MISVGVARTMLRAPESDNPVLEILIERATATLGRELGFYLGPPAQREVILDGGFAALFLADDPIGQVTIEHFDASVGDFVEVDATSYRVIDRRLAHNWRWPLGAGAVRARFMAGFEPDTGPAELRGLVLDLVGLKYRARGAEGLASESLGDYSYTRSDVESLESWRAAASRWRRTMPI